MTVAVGINGAVFDSSSFDTNAFSTSSWDFGDEAASVSKLYGCLYSGLYANIYVKPCNGI